MNMAVSARVFEQHRSTTEYSKSEPLQLDKARQHIALKAGYKHKVGGQFVHAGVWARLQHLITDHGAAARYQRAKSESGQILTASFIGAKARSKAINGYVNNQTLGKDPILKNNFYRQDFFRFRKNLADKDVVALSKRNKWALKATRMAHRFSGLNEAGVAPTGVALRITRDVFCIHKNKQGLTNHLVMVAALPIVGVMVSKLFVLPTMAYTAIVGSVDWFIKPMIVSFSALAASMALGSLGCSAVSTMLMDKVDLTPDVLQDAERSEKKHLNHILTVLRDVQNKPEAQKLLNMALSSKIPEKYKVEERASQSVLNVIADGIKGVKSDNPSLLVTQLLEAIQNEKNDRRALLKMEEVIGKYLTKVDPSNLRSYELIDIETREGKRLVTRRESHFVALANLIEHSRVNADDEPQYIADLRQRMHNAVVRGKNKSLNKFSKVATTLHCPKAAEKLEKISDKDWAANYMKARDLTSKVRNHVSSFDKVLANPHQYGVMTRSCARAAEALRFFNQEVVLSLNYLMSRPFTTLTKFLHQQISTGHASRSVGFSTGRFISGCIWAVLDVVLLIGPLHAIGALPHAIGFITIAANSTAFQMLAVGVVGLIPMALMHIFLQLEGWKGNIEPQMEPLNSKRKPLAWA